MPKAMLIMDMPKNCEECQFHYNTRDEDDEYVDKCEVLCNATIDGYTEKYEGCPLREVPKKFTEGVELLNARYGYNACIDEILGGGE